MMVFGYGSLINAKTHNLGGLMTPVKLRNWRRHWKQVVKTPHGEFIAMTIEKEPNSIIDGALISIDQDILKQLDIREAGYQRVLLDCGEFTDLSNDPANNKIYTYTTGAVDLSPKKSIPILQTYIDCILAGVIDFFGENHLSRFVLSTGGWHTPIINDRDSPLYARAQHISSDKLSLIDQTVRWARESESPC